MSFFRSSRSAPQPDSQHTAPRTSSTATQNKGVPFPHSGSGFTQIGEQVAVVGTYNHSTFRPRKFQWRGKVYPVDELTFVTDTRDEGVRRRIYSILSRGNLYRLVFNRDSEDWRLAEIWCE